MLPSTNNNLLLLPALLLLESIKYTLLSVQYTELLIILLTFCEVCSENKIRAAETFNYRGVWWNITILDTLDIYFGKILPGIQLQR